MPFASARAKDCVNYWTKHWNQVPLFDSIISIGAVVRRQIVVFMKRCREIVNTVAKQLHDSERATRFVTLSPLTEMAERFHLRNGATLLAKHKYAQNFEYKI